MLMFTKYSSLLIMSMHQDPTTLRGCYCILPNPCPSAITRSYVPSYVCGSLYQMARSHSTYQHQCGVGSQSVFTRLDHTIRCSFLYCHYGATILITVVENLLTLLGSRKARTTAYHPQSNGMVERFHRQLKAALKAQPRPSAWIDALPLVLLHVRCALKEDIAATAAEIVYGTTLRLPGEFVNPTKSISVLDPLVYVVNLRVCMQNLRPLQPRSLATATHVFVRHDALRKPLKPHMTDLIKS